MATIGKVSAVFTASSSGLVSGVNQSAAALGKLQKSVDSLRGGMTSLVAIQGAQLFGSIVSTASQWTSSLISMGQQEAEVIDQTSKLAARLGMTYGELAGLALAGDLAGVSMEQIGKAATKADVALVKAQQGSKLAQDAFAGLGLSIESLSGKSSADRFEAIAVSIAKLPSEAERAAAATKLFGKAGAELMPLFTGGAEGIAEARREAERLGLVLTSEQGREVEAMNDAFTMVKKSITGIVQQVVAYLAPTIRILATTFKDFVGSVGGDNIGKAIGTAIIEAAKYLATVADSVVNGFKDMYQNAADTLGLPISKEAKRLAEMNKQLMDDKVPLVNIGPGIAGRDPKFFKELSRLDEIVFAQRQRSMTFTNLVSEGEKKINEMLAKGPDGPSQPPKIPEPKEPPPVQFEQRALRGIDSRSSEGIAEMFRLMRGENGNVQEKQLDVLEQIRDAMERGDSIDEFVEVGFGA